MRRCHRVQKLRGQQSTRYQTIHQAGGVHRGANHETMIDPARMITVRVAPSRPIEIRGHRHKTRRRKIEPIKHKPPHGGTEFGVHGLLDELAHEDVANVRIRPAGAWGEVEFPTNPLQHFVHRPRPITPRNRVVIGDEPAIVWHAGAVLQQVTQRPAAPGQALVKRQSTSRNQLNGVPPSPNPFPQGRGPLVVRTAIALSHGGRGLGLDGYTHSHRRSRLLPRLRLLEAHDVEVRSHDQGGAGHRPQIR